MTVLSCSLCGFRVNAEAGRCPECGADPHLPAEQARAEVANQPVHSASRLTHSAPSFSRLESAAWLSLVVATVAVFALLLWMLAIWGFTVLGRIDEIDPPIWGHYPALICLAALVATVVAIAHLHGRRRSSVALSMVGAAAVPLGLLLIPGRPDQLTGFQVLIALYVVASTVAAALTLCEHRRGPCQPQPHPCDGEA